jgi:hypothetical protein
VARDRNQQRRRNRHHAAAKSKHGRCEDGDSRLLVNVDKFAAERRSAAATRRWQCLGAAAPIVRSRARWARHPCTPCVNLRAGWSRPCSAPDRDRRNPRARCPVPGPNMRGIGPANAAITARSTGKTHVRRLRRNKGAPLPVRTQKSPSARRQECAEDWSRRRPNRGYDRPARPRLSAPSD